jgi:hypothetical protein
MLSRSRSLSLSLWIDLRTRTIIYGVISHTSWAIRQGKACLALHVASCFVAGTFSHTLSLSRPSLFLSLSLPLALAHQSNQDTC